MINYDGLVKDYKKAMNSLKLKEKEIEKLRKERDKFKKDAEEIGRLRVENRNLEKANTRLVDTIKLYNPNHFGGGEGRHDNILPYEDSMI